jgi:hypothetical protein
MRSMPSVVLLLLALVMAIAAPSSAQCKLHAGDHVVLYSSGDDPDVLVWDSRFRLRDYHAASFDEAQQLLPHALLVAADARAIVEACVPDFVAPSLSAPADAVGIRIVTGPHRGYRGWVLGTDVRPNTRSRPSPRLTRSIPIP